MVERADRLILDINDAVKRKADEKGCAKLIRRMRKAPEEEGSGSQPAST